MTMKNPKLIHRIYFENFAPFRDPYEHFLESWVREMPDYKIMRWNASNLNVDEIEWTSIANKNAAPVFLSEYFRWKVLSEYGGIYLDADCEVLDGRLLHGHIEELFAQDEYDVFFGVEERSNGHPTAQTVAAKKGSGLVTFMKELYESALPKLWHWRERRGLIGPQLMSLYYWNQGINVADDGFFKNLDEPIIVGGAKVFPQTYFSPKFTLDGRRIDFDAGKTCVYHMFANSNMDFSQKRALAKMRKEALTFSEYRKYLETAQQFPREFHSDWLHTRIGARDDEAIVAGADHGGEASGVVVHGPYTAMEPGNYRAVLACKGLPTRGTARLAVTGRGGQLVMASRKLKFPLKRSEALEIPFSVEVTGLNDLEVVLEVDGIDRVGIEKLSFELAGGQKLDRILPFRTQAPEKIEVANDLKVLHRIYFGFDGKPDPFQRYLDTWKAELPGFKIMHWNASNLPMDINAYVRQLHAEKDHAFLTDFFRWHVLKEHGGVYLDADVEIVNGKLVDQLVEELSVSSKFDAFIGIDERSGGWYTAHSMASKPNSAISTFMCDLYANMGPFAAWRKKGFYFWAPQMTALYFSNNGHNPAGMGTTPHLEKPQIHARVKIYPQDWFSPLAPTGSHAEPFTLSGVSEDTCLCHHFACSWHEADSPYLKYSRTHGGQSNALLAEIVGRAAAKDRTFRADGQTLKTTTGRIVEDGIATSGKTGMLVYGPYVDLDPGEYEVRFDLAKGYKLSDACFDVCSGISGQPGQRVILPAQNLRKIQNDGQFTARFRLTRRASLCEFRLYAGRTSDFVVESVSVRGL